MDFLSVSDDYAIVKHPDNNWTFSIKKAIEPNENFNNVKLQLYTDDLNESHCFIKKQTILWKSIMYQKIKDIYLYYRHREL